MQNAGPPIPTGNIPDLTPLPPFSQTRPVRPLRTWPAVLTLFLLAALIPETIATYNSPPLLLITTPSTLLFICAFYGSIALLVREAIHRRSLRWTSILLLGMAAGSINEGIIAGTWYKVQYTGYVMIGGINPAVAVGLTTFHTFYSTILPILLVELLFPRIATRTWLRRKGILLFSLLLTLTTLAGLVPATNRNLKAVVLGGVLVLIITALALPRSQPRAISPKPAPGPGKLRWMGILGTILFFSVFAIIPGTIGPRVAPEKLPVWQMLPIVLMVGCFCLAIALGYTWSGRVGWGPRQALALITGALLPAIILSLVIPAALQTLEPVVTVPMLLLLIWLARRTKRLEATTQDLAKRDARL